MKAFVFIKEIFKKFPRLITVTILLLFFSSFIETITLLTVGPLVDFLVNPTLQNVSSLTQKMMKIMEFMRIPVALKSYLIIFVIFVIFSSVFRIFVERTILRTKYALIRDILLGTFRDFFNARWHFFSSTKQGVLLNTFNRELNTVGSAFGAIALFFVNLIKLIFYIAIPFYLSWRVTLIGLFTALLLSWPFFLLGKICYRLGKLNISTTNRISTIIHESITLAKVVLGFGNQHKCIDNLADAYDDHQRITIKSQTIDVAIPTLYRPLGAVVIAVCLFSARKFGVPLSEVAVLLLAMLQSVVSIGGLIARKNALETFFPSYEQIKNLRHHAKELEQKSGSRVFNGFNKEIGIKSASFAYPGHSPVLKNINLHIPKGKMVAIVGASGAGKSTLIDIIMGFNKPASGLVAVDDIPLFDFDINSYRRRIGYVPQDSILFNMSIRDNLSWADEEATDEDIRHACQLAYADEFIEKFPSGYNTLVGDRGIRLSGGQLQRVALARAILRRPQLLILDEATSSLDSHSERLIQHAVEDIAKETTIIVIAHRLSTITNADYIYVFSEGEIVEEGVYSELTQAKGHFEGMIKLQLLEAK